MGYTVYFSLSEIRFYDDETLVEINKTFARSYRRELTRLEKATGIEFNSIRDKYWSGEGYDEELFYQHFPEDANDCCFIERGGNYIKTNRKIYDIAIKKAILAVQKKFNNPLHAYCDDGFLYKKSGIIFAGAGLSEEYQPVKRIKVKFADMPISYQNKGGKADITIGYEWMEI